MKNWFLQNGLGDTDTGGAGEQGGTASDNTGGDSGDSNTGASNDSSAYVGPAWAKDLKLTVEKEILQDPALGPIGDLNSLVKSYVHAQRKIGQKGTLIPSENSTQEEWDTFWQKVGVPLEDAKYKESLKLDGLDPEFNTDYVAMAHKLRVTPKQAEQMHKFFADKTKNSSEKFMQDVNTKTEQELSALQEKIGPDAYNVKLAKANRFLSENAGPEFLNYLKESGLGKNAKIVESFMNIADKLMKEDALPSGDGGKLGMTKEDLNREINQAMGNFKDPYHNAAHPDHKRRVDEIQSYFAKLDKR